MLKRIRPVERIGFVQRRRRSVAPVGGATVLRVTLRRASRPIVGALSRLQLRVFARQLLSPRPSAAVLRRQPGALLLEPRHVILRIGRVAPMVRNGPAQRFSLRRRHLATRDRKGRTRRSELVRRRFTSEPGGRRRRPCRHHVLARRKKPLRRRRTYYLFPRHRLGTSVELSRLLVAWSVVEIPLRGSPPVQVNVRGLALRRRLAVTHRVALDLCVRRRLGDRLPRNQGALRRAGLARLPAERRPHVVAFRRNRALE